MLAPDKVNVPVPNFVIPFPVLLIIPDNITAPDVLTVKLRSVVPSASAAAKVKSPLLVPSPKITFAL